MNIHKGGNAYGFCPGKATWDYETVQKFRLLVITSDTGAMLTPGSILEQPAWYIELLGWFIPLYDQTKWHSKMRGLFGDGKTSKTAQSGVKNKGSVRKISKRR